MCWKQLESMLLNSMLNYFLKYVCFTLRVNLKLELFERARGTYVSLVAYAKDPGFVFQHCVNKWKKFFSVWQANFSWYCKWLFSSKVTVMCSKELSKTLAGPTVDVPLWWGMSWATRSFPPAFLVNGAVE